VPVAEVIQGVVVAPLGVRKYLDIFEQRADPRGKEYYWLAGEVITDGVDPDTDLHAIQQDLITITPLQFNLTDWGQLAAYGQWFTPYRD